MDATTWAAITTAIATVVLAAITAYYAWQTRQVTREAREARELVALPVLLASVSLRVTTLLYADEVPVVGGRRGPHRRALETPARPRYQIKGTITIRNIGEGPALDVELDAHLLNEDKSDIDITPVHKKFGILATKSRTVDLQAAYQEGRSEHPILEVVITYTNLHKRRLETRVHLEARADEAMADEVMADELKYPSHLTWRVEKEEFKVLPKPGMRRWPLAAQGRGPED